MHKFSANNLMTPDIVKHLHKQEPKGGGLGIQPSRDSLLQL